MLPTSAAKTIAKRWALVVALAIGVAIAIHLGLPYGLDIVRTLHKPSPANPLVLRVATWLSWVALAFFGSGISPIRFEHLSRAHRYPPLWLALPMGAAAALIGHHFLVALRFPNELVTVMWPWHALHVVSGVAVGLVVRALQQTGGPAQERRGLPGAIRQGCDWAGIERWMKSEEESADDLLGHAPIASRFAAVLGSHVGKHRGSAALVGPWGSGKTTILRWAEVELRQAGGGAVWSCWISCWGIDDSRQLAGHVLREVIATIDRHVDATGLRRIPDSYLKVLGATRLGPVDWLFRPDGEVDVLDRLTGIESVLAAVGARLVVFIEDGDRSPSRDFDPGHLERLMWRLRDLHRVSCVVALDLQNVPFDVSKLCEHIERLPPLGVEPVREVLAAVRDHCLTAFKFVRPAKPGIEKDRLDLKRSDQDGLLRFIRRVHSKDVCDAIADLISTPRRLKHVVRRISRAWQKLHGEVDIDDLIVMSVLKECCPVVFRFLLQNIDAVREKADEFNNRPEIAKKEWETLVEKDHEAARAVSLVNVLGLHQITAGPTFGDAAIQGVRHSEPTDYFARILAEDLGLAEVRDQAVLSDMDSWLHSGHAVMLDELTAGGGRDQYAKVWEYFAWRIPDDRFVEVVDGIFSRLLTIAKPTGRWEREALMGCWREHNRRRAEQSAMVGPHKLSEMIALVMPDSLAAANDLYYFWTTTQYGPYQNSDRIQVREAMVCLAKSLFTDPVALERSLRVDDEGWALRGLIFPADQQEPASAEIDPARWRCLAPVIVGALARCPDDIVIDVVRLVGDMGAHISRDPPVGPRTAYALNRERITALFGDGKDRIELLRLLSYQDDRGLDPSAVEAGQQSRAWLAEIEASRLDGNSRPPRAPNADTSEGS